MSASRFNRVNSFLWAAYGDALGFMTELRDERAVKISTGSSHVKTLRSWSRRIGGIYGAQVRMPIGAYSDDTQLRLAVCRAIDANGYFDVELFAKFELPLWQSYALGAGRGTKAAVENLEKVSINWFNNFFEAGRTKTSYVNAGGNGAAMRIQPHVLATTDLDDWSAITLRVFRDAICTHGHPRGILGAVFYALLLAKAIKLSTVPSENDWDEILDFLRNLNRVVESDSEIATFWLPSWNRVSNRDFFAECVSVIDEMDNALQLGKSWMTDEHRGTAANFADGYKKYLDSLGGFDPARRGSGTLAACTVAVSITKLCNLDTSESAAVYANTLGSDTDTIGTMAMAILGGLSSEPFERELQDHKLLVEEAARLERISRGEGVYQYSYPGVGGWKPPKAKQDYVFLVGDKMWVEGFGYVRPISEVFEGRTKSAGAWQWVSTKLGQTLLVRRRRQLEQKRQQGIEISRAQDLVKPMKDSKDLFRDDKRERKDAIGSYGEVVSRGRAPDIDHLTDLVIKSGFDEKVIGNAFLELIDSTGSIEKTVAFSAILAKARLVRNRR